MVQVSLSGMSRSPHVRKHELEFNQRQRVVRVHIAVTEEITFRHGTFGPRDKAVIRPNYLSRVILEAIFMTFGSRSGGGEIRNEMLSHWIG